MANEKRARQDANRQQKLAQAAVTNKKTQSVKQRNKFLKIAGAVIALVILALILNKCSSSGDDSADTTIASESSTTIASAAPTTAPKFASPKLAVKPVITIPAGTPPKKLEIKDIQVGTGATVEAGDTVFVQYAGNSFSSKAEFDSTWGRGAQPFEIQDIGQAPLIAGWNQGLIGMKVGGRRQLIIPPDLAYGAEAKGDKIKANDTLVFVIDAVQVIKAADVAKSKPTIAQ